MLKRRMLDYLILISIGAALGVIFICYGRDGLSVLAFLFGGES